MITETTDLDCFRTRFRRDKCAAMTIAQWAAWMLGLPVLEYWSMHEAPEVRRCAACGLVPAAFP
jgi:hypothetical protein